MEIWKTWKETNNPKHGIVVWKVSNLGNVLKNDHPYEAPCINSGYKKVSGGSGELLHRLVAKLFIENPDNLPCVDHINGNKLDNRSDNLQWISYHNNNLKSNVFSTGGIAASRSINSVAIRVVTCPHCNKTGKLMPMNRWHFDNCKHANSRK